MLVWDENAQPEYHLGTQAAVSRHPIRKPAVSLQLSTDGAAVPTSAFPWDALTRPNSQENRRLGRLIDGAERGKHRPLASPRRVSSPPTRPPPRAGHAWRVTPGCIWLRALPFHVSAGSALNWPPEEPLGHCDKSNCIVPRRPPPPHQEPESGGLCPAFTSPHGRLSFGSTAVIADIWARWTGAAAAERPAEGGRSNCVWGGGCGGGTADTFTEKVQDARSGAWVSQHKNPQI